ncbi:MAG: SDR family oxidoreductase, partial [Actinobacteria bacterium]|nr:SDR family oxidoreductase [Actinomycetota bacterium]
MLEGRKLLITGVLNRDSIAYAVARLAQERGAEVLLTGFGRARRLTERAAKTLPTPADVIELDVNNPDDLAALTTEIADRWGTLDGALHAIAFAPSDALGGNFMETPSASAEEAFRTSAFSYKALAGALLPVFP